jgi:site-specific DNA-cytosine methylase
MGIKLDDCLEQGWYSSRKKSYCIDANYGKGSNLRRYLYCGSRQLVFKDGFTIPHIVTKDTANKFGSENKAMWRMLTPQECEKLQTVPEGYTDTAPKVWRYHMIGNGWTVDVIAHILKGLK